MRGMFDVVREVGAFLDESGVLWWLHVVAVGVLLFASAKLMLAVDAHSPWLPRLKAWGVVAISEACALVAHCAAQKPGERLAPGAVWLAGAFHLAAIGTIASHAA